MENTGIEKEGCAARSGGGGSRAFRQAGDEFDARARAGRRSRACKASRLFFSRVLACAGSAKAAASSDGQWGVAVVLSLAVAASCVADLLAGGGRAARRGQGVQDWFWGLFWMMISVSLCAPLGLF